MLQLPQTLTPAMCQSAHAFAAFRQQCKDYLERHHLNYDKFTVVNHDSFIGYVTEKLIAQYLRQHYAHHHISVQSWDSAFDMKRIWQIVQQQSAMQDDVQYVRDYFYDRYDLRLAGPKGQLLVDIKTALTQKEPQPNWNFLYPVVQADKPGKDAMLLCYYVVSDKANIESLQKLVVPGCITPTVFATCNKIPAGSQTRFGTVSQVDNYETELGQHYKHLDVLVGNADC